MSTTELPEPPTGTTPVPERVLARVALPFLAVVLVWGTTWIVIRDQLSVVDPSWSIAFRFTAGAAALFTWLAVRRESMRLDRRGHVLAVLLGALQFVANFNFVYRAEAFVTSGVVAVVYALLLVPNAILARVLLGQRLSRAFVIGSAIGIGGLGVLFAHELQGLRAESQVALGLLLTVGGVLVCSFANVLQATAAMKRYPIPAMLAWAMLYGSAGNAVIALVLRGLPVLDARPAYWAGVVYLGVAGSALTFVLYYGLIRAIGPARAAYTSVLIPVIAMAISTVVEGYRWSAEAALGSVLVLVGLVIALSARRPAR